MGTFSVIWMGSHGNFAGSMLKGFIRCMNSTDQLFTKTQKWDNFARPGSGAALRPRLGVGWQAPATPGVACRHGG